LGLCEYIEIPTLLWMSGLRVVIYSNDHRPAHVHVIGNGCEALLVLNCPDAPPDLRENCRFAIQGINAIVSAFDL
jgi:hypothetical protein